MIVLRAGLNGVERGAYNTKPAAHAAGATVSLLTQVYGAFLPDPATDMIDEIAGNLARAVNEAGMEMVYFDGIEAHSATGPPGIAESMLHQSFFNHLKGDALVESSSGGGSFRRTYTRAPRQQRLRRHSGGRRQQRRRQRSGWG